MENKKVIEGVVIGKAAENLEDNLPKKIGTPVFKVECHLGSHIIVADDKIRGALKSGWTFDEREAPALFTVLGTRGSDGDLNRYSFISEHNDYVYGEVVLCDTKHGITFGKIVTVGAEPVRLESTEGFRRIIGRVDIYEEVMARYRQLETEEMKSKLYDMKKKFDERLVFQLLAESSPEAARLLEELKRRGAM